jgi:outer membrane protein TolC
MQAYFAWKQSTLAVEIYHHADTLLQEASRSTQRMINNGVALPTALSRINAEIATVKGQIIEAKVQERNAWSYLLFYVGNNDMTQDQVELSLPDIPDIPQTTSNTREELAQLELGRQMQDLALEKEEMFYKPRLAAQLDIGSQDFNFGIEPYALLGLNLEINIFDGKQNKARQSQALAAINASEAQIKYHTDQLALQNQISLDNLIAAIDQVYTYQPRIAASNKDYRAILLKYREGTASYLELLDSRTQVMQSELSFLIAKFQAWNRWAEYQFTSASYPIN